ncbi:MAG: ComEC/Rec2 family competence protein [Sediminibacterium sp.]|uniref:ComEC/Rec2 family competence protein n=1 Tax=Sediminibacterium sp. TaxID=1917865 RepID=UPI002AB7F767|nr:ComEC/Rec2 family competence protein [Sediminibacterium sp.]MDZ4072048.1 ComEC/Rec2 family competence protein [Sediminibacterium sp.]
MSIPLYRKIPFIRILPCFIAGILIQYYFPHAAFLPAVVLLISLLLLMIHAFISVRSKFRFRKLTATLLYTSLFCIGSLLTRERNISYQKNWIGKYATEAKSILLQFSSQPIERDKTWKIEANILAFQDQQGWKKASGRILLYIDKRTKGLQKDQQIITEKSLQPITRMQNPGSFDYAAYCARQGIYHSLYLTAKDFYVAQQTKKAKNILTQAQEYVKDIFQQYIRGQQEKAIAEALTIGYKYDLDDDLLQAYSNTGVVHVIVISGMHLGLIYGILLFFTKLLQRNTISRWIRTLCILLLIWTFTLLTGAGPSVLRAAVIFSLMMLGESLLRKNNTYNTLAASAFLLLLVNPFYLWDIGFQLSYLAVLSIIWLSGPLYRSVYISFRPFRYVWQLMAVTISAQVLTTPIILYHFHQFPNVFLITNLLIVPLSGLVLYGCIVLLVVSPSHAVAMIAGNIIENILRVMNQMILFFDQLNFTVTNHIELHFIQVVLYYVMVITIGCRIIYKKPIYTIIGGVSGLVIVGFHSNRQITIRNTGRLVIYQSRGQTMTDIGSGGAYYSWTSDHPDKKAEKFLMSSRTQLGLVQRMGILSTKEYPVVRIKQHRLVFTDKAPIHGSFPVDIVVVQQGSFLNMSDLHRVFNARQYIFDGNNALWKIRKWKKEADSLHLRHHSVPEQGAFVMEY